MYSPTFKINGYHGTYPENLSGILKENFRESTNHNIWLGDGVYFFIDGISVQTPKECAKQYAIDSCYDKEQKKYTRSEICVLEAVIKINSDKMLDLTDILGRQLFNKFRKNVIDKITAAGKEPLEKYRDSDILKYMRQTLGIEFVKADVYIKFAVQRIYRIESIIPNVTILAVNNPSKNILKPTIKEILREKINQ